MTAGDFVMPPALQDKPAHHLPRVWEGKSGWTDTNLSLMDTAPGDSSVNVVLSNTKTTLAMPLTAGQGREVAFDVLARCDVIDPDNSLRNDLARALIAQHHTAIADHLDEEMGADSPVCSWQGDDGPCGGCRTCVYAQSTHLDYTDRWPEWVARADSLLGNVRAQVAFRAHQAHAAKSEVTRG